MKFHAIALLVVIAFSATNARKCWPATNRPAPTDGTDAPTNAPTDAPTNAPTDAPTDAPSKCNRAEIKRLIVKVIISGPSPGDLQLFVQYVLECLRSIGLNFKDADVTPKLEALFNALWSFIDLIKNHADPTSGPKILKSGISFIDRFTDLIESAIGKDYAAFMASDQANDFASTLGSFADAFSNFAAIPENAYTFVKADTTNFEDLIDDFFTGLEDFTAAAQSEVIVIPE